MVNRALLDLCLDVRWKRRLAGGSLALDLRYRYGDSNPGFRTEKLPVRLRVVAAVPFFGFLEPFMTERESKFAAVFDPLLDPTLTRSHPPGATFDDGSLPR
jgi:hypothetical protein